MNKDTFLKMLQSILTMADPTDPASVACAKAILVNLLGLIRSSEMANGQVKQLAIYAEANFRLLINHRDEFAGKPGDISGNQAKRDRLEMTLTPHC